MRPDETLLWRRDDEGHEVSCVMVSCCSGAELQVQRGTAIVLRELYPDKSTVYERAEQLRTGGQHESLASPVAAVE